MFWRKHGAGYGARHDAAAARDPARHALSQFRDRSRARQSRERGCADRSFGTVCAGLSPVFASAETYSTLKLNGSESGFMRRLRGLSGQSRRQCRRLSRVPRLHPAAPSDRSLASGPRVEAKFLSRWPLSEHLTPRIVLKSGRLSSRSRWCFCAIKMDEDAPYRRHFCLVCAPSTARSLGGVSCILWIRDFDRETSPR